MSRITKTIAEFTATQLVKSKREALASLKKDFKNKVREEVLKEIPLEVLSFYKKFPKYIVTHYEVRFYGNGWNFQRISLDKEFPSLNRNTFQYLPEPVISKTLLSIYNKIEVEKLSIDLLKSDLEIAIFNLRTYKSVEENFPEAFALLPAIVNNSIALNLSDIRNRVNNL